MKIDSKFHDFYDDAIMFGVDKKIRYHRETRGPYFYSGSRFNDLDRNSDYTIPIPMNDFESIVRAYRLYLYGHEDPRHRMHRILHQTKHPYQYVIRNLLFIGQRALFWHISTPYHNGADNNAWRHYTNKEMRNAEVHVYEVGEDVDITNSVNYDNYNVHVFFDSPLVLFQDVHYPNQYCGVRDYREYRRVIVNPVLSAIGFQRILDSYETRQLIENTVVSLNCTEQSDDNIPNDCKITGHGFDIKQSFRHRK